MLLSEFGPLILGMFQVSRGMDDLRSDLMGSSDIKASPNKTFKINDEANNFLKLACGRSMMDPENNGDHYAGLDTDEENDENGSEFIGKNFVDVTGPTTASGLVSSAKSPAAADFEMSSSSPTFLFPATNFEYKVQGHLIDIHFRAVTSPKQSASTGIQSKLDLMVGWVNEWVMQLEENVQGPSFPNNKRNNNLNSKTVTLAEMKGETSQTLPEKLTKHVTFLPSNPFTRKGLYEVYTTATGLNPNDEVNDEMNESNLEEGSEASDNDSADNDSASVVKGANDDDKENMDLIRSESRRKLQQIVVVLTGRPTGPPANGFAVTCK